MTDNNITSVFFLGIGGIGMSAIARFFHSCGYAVAGYDRTASLITDELQKEGITVLFDESIDVLPEQHKIKQHTLVVRTPAVPHTQKQYQWYRDNGFCIKKRSEVLGDITRNMNALCVAGTHGKTTISTILAHLMYQSNINTNAFLGGISNNYGTNLLISKESNYVVVEADEYDRSFHHLTPYMAIVTGVDPDHLDIYGDEAGFREGFEHFTSLIRKDGVLLLKHGLAITPRTAKGVKTFTYTGIKDTDTKADFYAENVVVSNGNIYFDFVTPHERITNMKLGVPVWINIENSVAAMAIAWLNGVTESELRLGLASYAGVYRRFNIKIKNNDVVYIDDYAHHPIEIQKSLQSMRRLFPDSRLTVIFQPHLFSRTKDFADAFAKELSGADELILLPIYPAREEPIEGVCSEMLQQKVTIPCRVLTKDRLIEYMQAEYSKTAHAADSAKADGLKQPQVIATIGAGDIDRLVPVLTKIFKGKA